MKRRSGSDVLLSKAGEDGETEEPVLPNRTELRAQMRRLRDLVQQRIAGRGKRRR